MRTIDADGLKETILKKSDSMEDLWDTAGVLNAAEFPFVHVTIKHPRFGKCDGWLDKQRQLLFFDFITTEVASKWNWSWEADNEGQ